MGNAHKAPKKAKLRAMKHALTSLIFLCLLGLASCQQAVTQQVPEVINSFPHDEAAFTQGLLLYDGKLYESTGLNGASSLREVDLETGKVIRILPLAERYFGEGLARVDDKLIQITWRNGEAFVYDLETFEQEEIFTYSTEGWGLCFDGEDLYMSDGSAQLYRRDPETFEEEKVIDVTLSGESVNNLNELECVGEHVYANVWQTDRIVKIDKASGRVVSEIDASGLFPASERPSDPNAVLNGVAYNPESETFYLTGKLWPSLFEVRFTEP